MYIDWNLLFSLREVFAHKHIHSKLTKSEIISSYSWLYDIAQDHYCGGKTGQNTRDSPEASSRPFIIFYMT